MKFLCMLILLAVTAYVIWPFYHIYQLSSAITNNDKVAFEELIDIKSIKKVHKENLEWQINNTIGNEKGNLVIDVMREGAKVLGNTTTDVIITTESIFRTLQKKRGSILEQFSFAFFDSIYLTRFVIRLGKLGQNPIHVHMTRQDDWYWRITAIYD